MSDERPEETAEESALDAVLEALDGAPDGVPVPNAGEPAARLHREYLETFGLLGLAAGPLEPSPRVKERLLATLGAAEAAGGQRPAGEVLPHPGSGTVARTATTGWPRRALQLAATLTFVLLGLCVWQFFQLERQRSTIDRLTAEVADAHHRALEMGDLREQLDAAQAKLDVLTTTGTEYCRLAPVGADPLHPDSRGALFVAADHKHWYLKVVGLGPSPTGQAYQLWFITHDGQPVSAGTFDVRPGVRVELSSPDMPDGVGAVSVTLEPAGGSSEPSGPQVLYGDQAMRLL